MKSIKYLVGLLVLFYLPIAMALQLTLSDTVTINNPSSTDILINWNANSQYCAGPKDWENKEIWMVSMFSGGHQNAIGIGNVFGNTCAGSIRLVNIPNSITGTFQPTFKVCSVVNKTVTNDCDTQGFTVTVGSQGFTVTVGSQSATQDTTEPWGKISGIGSSYDVGDTISCNLVGEDDTNLSKLTFQIHTDADANGVIDPDPINWEKWDVNGTEAEKYYSVSTLNWSIGDYEYFYFVEDAAENYKSYTGSFSLSSVEVNGINNNSTATVGNTNPTVDNNNSDGDTTVPQPPSDTTPPTISISSPTDNITLEETINISGTATDNIEVEQVIWENNRGGSGDTTAMTMVDGTTSWNQDIVLQSGENIITIIAYDTTGLWNSVSLTITKNIANCDDLSIEAFDPVTRKSYVNKLVQGIEKNFGRKLRKLLPKETVYTNKIKSQFIDIANSQFKDDILIKDDILKLEALYRINPYYNVSSNPVNTVKVLEQDQDGKFLPNEPITRLEALIFNVKIYEFFYRKEITLSQQNTPAFFDSSLDFSNSVSDFMQKGFEKDLVSGYVIEKDAAGNATKTCFLPNNYLSEDKSEDESIEFVDKLITALKKDIDRIMINLDMRLMDGVNDNTWPTLSAKDTTGTEKTLDNIYSEVGIDLSEVGIDLNESKETFDDPREGDRKGKSFANDELHQLMMIKGVKENQDTVNLFFLSSNKSNDSGVMFETSIITQDGKGRDGAAVFLDTINETNVLNMNNSEQKYLYNTAHELGHALNLVHRDSNDSRGADFREGATIMNQGSMNKDWVYEWNTKSLNHFYSHPLDRIMPNTQYEHTLETMCHDRSTPVNLLSQQP
ncbi:MAG: Ig-like domain-containing protein [Candidatus Marithrix sp.]